MQNEIPHEQSTKVSGPSSCEQTRPFIQRCAQAKHPNTTYLQNRKAITSHMRIIKRNSIFDAIQRPVLGCDVAA